MNVPGSPDEIVAAPGSVLRRRWSAFVVSLLLGGAFWWLLEAGALPVLPSAEARAAVAWWAVPVYAALYVVLLFVRAARFHWLAAPIVRLPLREVVAINWVFFGALLVLPFRMGEVVRPVLAVRAGKLSVWQGFGMVAAERVVDGLMSSLLLLGALLWVPLQEPLPDRIGTLPVSVALIARTAYAMLGVFAAAFLVTALFYGWRDQARRFTERALGIVSRRLGLWVADKIAGVADGLRFLPRWRFFLPFVASSALYWTLNVVSAWLLMRGCGLTEATLGQAAAVIGVLALGTLLPSPPGFFGTFQFSVYAAIAMYFTPAQVVEAGSAVVFWMYVVQLVLVVGGGALALGPSLRARAKPVVRAGWARVE